MGRGQLNWSVSTYFCTKHMYNQNLVFVSCTHRDLYLMYLYLIYAPLVNQGCKVFMLYRSQRKNGEEKFFVRWSRRCRAVQLRLAATHISRSQCHNIAAATLVHRTLTFEPPAPSCFSEQIIRFPWCPPQLHLAGEVQLELNPALSTRQAGDNTES